MSSRSSTLASVIPQSTLLVSCVRRIFTLSCLALCCLSVAHASPAAPPTALAQLPIVSGVCPQRVTPSESAHLEITRGGVTLNRQSTSLKQITAHVVSAIESKSAKQRQVQRAEIPRVAMKLSARSGLAMREVKPWLQALINAGVTDLFVATRQISDQSGGPLWLSLHLDQRKRARPGVTSASPDGEPLKGPFVSLSASGLKIHREGEPEEAIKLSELKLRAPELLGGEVTLSVNVDAPWSLVVEVASYACDHVKLTWDVTVLSFLSAVGVEPTQSQGGVSLDDSLASTRGFDTGLGAQQRVWVGLGRRRSGRRIAKIKLAPPQVKGGLPAQVVRRTMIRRLSSMRGCYQRQLDLTPDLRGRLSLRFDVDPRGRVKAVDLKSQRISQSSLKSCIKSQIKRLRFPQAESGESTSVRCHMMLRAHKR